MEIFEIKDIRNCTIYIGHILRKGVVEMRLESSVTEAWLNIVECPRNRSDCLVIWSPVYVCIIRRAVSFVFSFAMLGSRGDNDASDRDQDNDAVVDVDDHLHQIGLWFSFAQ